MTAEPQPAVKDKPAARPTTSTCLERLPEYAERCRLLHNRIRRLLPKGEQDELLELSIALGMASLDQQARREGPA